MSKFSFFFGVFVALCSHARVTESARTVAVQVSAHRQLGGLVLSEQQQKLRKASQAAEASLVCGMSEINEKIKEATDPNGVQEIPWGNIKTTAAAGLSDMNVNIQKVKADIEELKLKIAELTKAAQWKDMSTEDMYEMLAAACQIEEFNDGQGEPCKRARGFQCGYHDSFDEAYPGAEIPFQTSVDAFTAIAEKKFTGYNRLTVGKFRKHCAKMLASEEAEEGCDDLCTEFANVVSKLSQNEAGAVNLAERETLDGAINKKQRKEEELQAAIDAQNACIAQKNEIDELADQLGKLGVEFKIGQKLVGVHKRALKKEEMSLKRALVKLKAMQKALERAKILFAEADAHVQAKQDAVIKQQAMLDQLIIEHKAQIALIAELKQKVEDIEAATAAGKLLKEQLSVILLHTADYNSQAVHTPLRQLGVTPGRNIADEFDKAEDDSSPQMMQTVQAVGAFCSDKKVEILSAVQDQLGDTTHQMAFICTGVDWNNMIVEAQGVVKKDAQEIVDILVEEQDRVIADNDVPEESSRELREAHGEPAGLREAVAIYGGNKGTFMNTYVSGWAVEEKGGAVAVIGNMLMLYQELGKAIEATQKKKAQAEKAEKVLSQKVQEAVKEMQELQALLKDAIAKREIAENKMKEAQDLVEEAEEAKTILEKSVGKAKELAAQAQGAFTDVWNALMSGHANRQVALLELQEKLQEKGE